MKTVILKISGLGNSDLRLDASFHLSDGQLTLTAFKKSNINTSSLRQVTERIFYGGRSRRVYVSNPDHGLPFIKGADIINASFSNLKYLSRRRTANLEEYNLMEGWTLITRSGTIGNSAYVNRDFIGKAASDDIIRVVPISRFSGFLYAFLSSKHGRSLLTHGTYGAVIQHIEPEHIENIPIPIFENEKQQQINSLITQSAELRVNATELLKEAGRILKLNAGLESLHSDDYEYFGARSSTRKISCFSKNISNIGSTSINAFNHSQRISKMADLVQKNCKTLKLFDVLDHNKLFTSGSFPRVEVASDKGIMLINQSDIFNTIIKGKRISRKKVKVDNLVKYGEVLIAGVGTLGESEVFCRVVFAGESIQDQLISGEFIRMRTNENMPSGYLYAWLNSDYGFRFIRSTQSGTKQCRPIHQLLLNMPVPILEKDMMIKIHNIVIKAHKLRFEANLKENQAIQLVEKEIEQWQN